MDEYILKIRDLAAYFTLDEGELKAVDGVSFDLKRNETIGIIGESGSGKSVLVHSILGMLQKPGRMVSGEILYNDGVKGEVDLAKKKQDGEYLRDIRGKEISMIFQEPSASLGPVYSIGHQLVEAVTTHQRIKDKSVAREQALDILERVGMPNPQKNFDDYPHLLSGGMCQRVMIALALVNRPKILIADEPTTALDVTVQAQIIKLLKQLQHDYRMSTIYISHDMGVVADIADKIAVMYLGRLVEIAVAEEIYSNPLHPYTKKLLKSMPVLGKKTGARLETIQGNVPLPINFPPQCGFYSRCTEARDQCRESVPPMFEVSGGHFVRCVHYDESEVS